MTNKPAFPEWEKSTKKIYNERSLYQKELASVREREEKIEKLDEKENN